jgi:uncharacterized protein YodC (DUF2158 family)
MNFVPGDVVTLRSGGPQMTIKFIDEGDVYCEWFLNGEVKGATFVASQLEKV